MAVFDGASDISELRLDLVPGMSRGADGRIRGIVTGTADAEVIDRIVSLAPPAADGQAAPIYVIDSESRLQDSEFCRRPSWSGRVRIFSGSDAGQAFLRSRRDRLECALPEYLATCLNGDPSLSAQIVVGLQGLAYEQSIRVSDLSSQLAAIWKSRGLEHWRARFASLQRQPGARVLVITSRYSTFVRFSAEDVVHAINQAGHQATLLMEPEEGETLTSIAYLDAILSSDPDVILQINYPRWTMGPAIPQGWPHVCWVQDAMQHLFQGTGSAGPLDFVVGHLYPDAMARAGYKPEQMMPHRVCVSERKFHADEAADDPRFSCDVAYVSHRSETPDTFFARFCAESGMPTSARPAIDAARQEIDSIVARWGSTPGADALPGVAANFARALGRGGDSRSIEIVSHRFVRPYAEQKLRHETLDWAAAICRRNGLTLRIFGKGWEHHPTLSSYAGGPIPHGDDLRRCYQLAAVHLHASIDGGGHQRISECAMSGGMPLCRRSWSELYFADWIAAREFIREGRPFDVCLHHWHRHAHVIADHAPLMHLIRNRDRMGPNPYGWDHARLAGLFILTDKGEPSEFEPLIPQPHMQSLSLFRDPIEATFSTPDELEDRILKAAARGSWRAQMSESIARRAVECVGVSRFVERILSFIGDALVEQLPCPDASTRGGDSPVGGQSTLENRHADGNENVPSKEDRRHVVGDRA